jgi:hypothetical protein
VAINQTVPALSTPRIRRERKPKSQALIMPIGYAMIGKLAPKQYQGVMMGSWMLVTGLASLVAGDFSGMIPEPTGTTAVATNAGYAKLFAELGAGSLVVGIVLVVLIETHSLPTLVRCYPCSFTFYVSDPSVSFHFCAS